MTRWEKQKLEISYTPAELNRLMGTKSYYAGTFNGIDLYLKRGWGYKLKSIVRSIVRLSSIEKNRKDRGLVNSGFCKNIYPEAIVRKTYYCVASSNRTKSGRFISAVTRLQDWILPFNRYDKSSETYYDYFCDRERALEFASLLRGRK